MLRRRGLEVTKVVVSELGVSIYSASETAAREHPDLDVTVRGVLSIARRLQLDDLREGMILEGVVTNVTRFGVFVDIGVHQDGLVHISQLANKYVQDPSEVVSVGDVVKVKVLEVDLDRRRVALSRKQCLGPGGQYRMKAAGHRRRPPGPGQRFFSSRPLSARSHPSLR
ncbi:MAG: S1 RNA-binding domain-containing protein [Verrucomicrobiaceae bacterium]|nr:S1 RNA-binding domain-containing protein [Verrucomicrobiaceae bacterium]